MNSLVKDTNRLVGFLQNKGYTQEQAEGFVEAVKDFDLSAVATGTDILELRFQITKTIFQIVLGQIAVQTALFVAVIELLVS